MKFLVRTIFLPFLFLIWTGGCSSGGKLKQETFVPLPQSVANHIRQATFEVVVAKETNTSLIFDRDPMEDMPSQKRGDPYLSIGTAFLIGPNRYVSAAHVFQVDAPSLFSVLKLRDVDGKIYTPTQVTRCSNFRDLIEFQVDQPDQTRIPLEISAEYSPGQTIFAAGNIDGDGITYHSAQTLQSIPEPTEKKWKYIRYYSPHLGMAIGGPLVNEKGQVVGVLVNRDQKERIDFGVPISELGALPTDHAEFYRKKIFLRTLPRSVAMDWFFSPSLPKNIEQLLAESRASLSNLFKKTYAEIAEDKNNRYFPKHPGFKSYVRTQDMVSNLGFLSSDPYGNRWRIIKFKPDYEKELSSSQQVKDYLARGFIPITAMLPQDEKIGEFNSDPAKIAGTMIIHDSLGVFSKIGSDSLLMSVSKPDHVSTWTDHLGRVWTTAHWYYQRANFALSTICTPVPIGSACIVRIGNYSRIALEDDFMPQLLDQVMVSYRGTLAQWKTFFSEVDSKLMPQALKEARIDYLAGKNVEVHVGRYSYNFPSPKITNDTQVIVKMGYDPNQELGSTVLDIDLFPEGDEKEWLAIETRYSPTDDATEVHKSNWKNLFKKNAPYDGIPEIRKNNGARRIMSVLELHPGTVSEVESALVAICEAPEKRPEEDLKKTCDKFIQSLSVQPQ